MKTPSKPGIRVSGRGLARWPAFALLLAAVAILLLAAGCSPAGGIVVSDPMARPAPLEGGTGGAFMTLRNAGVQSDRLRSASSPAAQSVELHETVDDNGIMRMVPQPDGWELAPGGRLELMPGGKHIMLIGLVQPLTAGETIEITLHFDEAGEIEVQVPVKQM